MGSWVMWAMLVGGPLLGMLAIALLVMLHEHSPRLSIRAGAPRVQGGGIEPFAERLARVAPLAIRRSSTMLLDDYLLDERDAALDVRRARQSRLLTQTERASTHVFEAFLADRAGVLKGSLNPRPARITNRAPAEQRVPALRPVRVLQPDYQRAARATRLVPLSPEIAIG